MKRKNGFTLIELLAVIVILAIIALIATPLVLKYIEKSRKESKVDSAYSFVRNLETEIANYSIKNNGAKYNKAPIGGDYYEFKDFDTDKDIDTTVKGDNPNTIKVCLSSLGQVEKAMFQYGKYYVSYDGKKGSISDKDTYNNFSCSGNGGADSFKRVYEYGDEVTFNPGDGDRTWNVIGEDKDTVTLMLTENLGNTVAWYAYSNHNSYDNSYGPKDALEYLNSLTKDWNNVDPIASYSYVNNLNGTAKPYGYQKIEINNGVTTLTHQDGTTTKLDETNKAKARLLTLEDVLEIASKVNPNLKEENLRKYIETYLEKIENLERFKEVTTLTNKEDKVDKVIEIFALDTGFNYYSKHFQTYYLVLFIPLGYGIEVEYLYYENNMLKGEVLLDFLYQNLWSEETEQTKLLPYGYWTLSAYAGNSGDAWFVPNGGIVGNDHVDDDSLDGVRPVITVSKSKL